MSAWKVSSNIEISMIGCNYTVEQCSIDLCKTKPVVKDIHVDNQMNQSKHRSKHIYMQLTWNRWKCVQVSSIYFWLYEKMAPIFKVVRVIWRKSRKQVSCMRIKMLFTFFKYLFFSFQRYPSFQKISKLAKRWRHTLNQILISYNEKRYLGQFE